jgi:uncharacterized protein YggE
MIRHITMASALALSTVPLAAASAQTVVPVQTINGTRLDVVATGEVTRVPDIARISTGVITTAPSATAALEQNAAQMRRVRDALRRAGIADRDVQTSAINLYPDYRQDERGGNPQLIGYRAQNEVTVRFRDIANTGKILDALVAEGANQINGPMLSIDKPEAALDEARTKALANARARAELYARATGKKVGRIVAISEGGAGMPGPIYGRAASMMAESTKIDPGEQALSVTLSVTFELE